VQCINYGDKEEENQEEMKIVTKLYCLILQNYVTFVSPRDTKQHIAPRKLNLEGEAVEEVEEAVLVVAIKADESLWGHATNVENLVIERMIVGKSNRTGTNALKDTD
jgi:hypothetical protein